jgi:hypothetical protein
MSRVSDFRKNAETCRAQATTQPTHNKSWLQLADRWDQLAHEADRQPGAFLGANGA